jgi:enediyne biosynthesis protein E4
MKQMRAAPVAALPGQTIMRIRLTSWLSLSLACLLCLALEAATPLFTDVTKAAGISFVHNNGAAGKRFYPETMGSGALVLDVDADGWQDLLLVNSTRFKGERGSPGVSALYRNKGDGTFTNITAGSGLDVEMYGMGGAAGDYDNDGRVDVYITAYGGGRLFRNLGGGKFADVTLRARAIDAGWSTSAMWFDYDRDGFLDLLVARYLEWDPEHNVECSITGTDKTFCPPTSYRGIGPQLFRNRRNGTFVNVTAAAGFEESNSKNLGVAMLDLDADGWLDAFIASDGTPNLLRRNNRNGTFTDVASKGGVATTPNGQARAGMGVDAADFDGSGRPGLIVGNFSEETMAVYRNEGGGLFVDEASRSAIGRESRLSLTFGLFFFDADLDGLLDIFAANGHISDTFPPGMTGITYAQRPHLFRNLGGRRFEETITATGSALARAIVGRGAAYADFDNDGDLDLVVTENHGPARLFRNELDGGAHALRVKLIGVTANRDAIGARVSLTRADGTTVWALVKTGSSYLSQSELPLTFGLGAATTVRGVTITWPAGTVESLGAVAVDQAITIREGMGIVARTPLRPRR